MAVSIVAAIASLAVAGVFATLWQKSREAARAEYIRHYTFPPGLFDKLRKKHPELSLKDCQLVANGLRQFFLTYLKSGRRFVSMPSQVVDDLWHELILYTRHYEQFCSRAFGRFMHHTPAVVLSADKQNNTGLRRCWWHACREENIDPSNPTRLPLLFALDSKLGIADGFHYRPDCKGPQRSDTGATGGYCGGDFSDASIDGSTDGFGDGGTGDGGSDGCGGGCGGGD